MKNILFIILVLNCFAWKTFGQSVEAFIALAHENHPGLKATKYEYAAAKQRIDQQGDYPDPQVNLGVGILPTQTRVGAQLFKVGVSQAILWKGTLDARRDLAAAQAEVFAATDQVQEKDIENRIRGAYATLVFLDEQIAVIKKKLNLLDLLEEITKSAVSSGQGKLSNVLLVERKRESLLADQELAEKEKEWPTIRINRLSGRQLLEGIQIEPLDFYPLVVDDYVDRPTVVVGL